MGNYHARFLEGWGRATVPGYSTKADDLPVSSRPERRLYSVTRHLSIEASNDGIEAIAARFSKRGNDGKWSIG